MERRPTLRRGAVAALCGLGALAAAAAGFNEPPSAFQLWMMMTAAVLVSLAAFPSGRQANPRKKTPNLVHLDAPGSAALSKKPNYVDMVDLVDIASVENAQKTADLASLVC